MSTIPIPELSLNLGVLSSFNITGTLGEVFQFCHDHNLSCELYTFMQPTVDDFLKQPDVDELKSLKTSTVLEFLADCNQTPSAEQLIANIIQDANNGYNVKIVSLASFFPDLSSKPNPDEPNDDYALLTRQAICFLAKLALALRARGHSELKTIELVAGSLVNRPIIKKTTDDELNISVTTFDPEVAIKNITENLCMVLEMINDKTLTFAIEIEPGPLYAVNNLVWIDKLCEVLDREQRSHGVLENVGLNLDIAHWNILLYQNQLDENTRQIKYDPVDICEKMPSSQYKRVFERICHAHISGYHRAAHFGDLLIKSTPPESPVMDGWDESFSQWIKLLKKRKGKISNRPEYHGNLICELEATADDDKVTVTKTTLETKIRQS